MGYTSIIIYVRVNICSAMWYVYATGNRRYKAATDTREPDAQQTMHLRFWGVELQFEQVHMCNIFFSKQENGNEMVTV